VARQRCRERNKVIVLTHYGNGRLACVLCGYSNLDALQLDHVNDDGYLERAARDGRHRLKAGVHFYALLLRRRLPPGFQTLCANCNALKQATVWRARRANPYRRRTIVAPAVVVPGPQVPPAS